MTEKTMRTEYRVVGYHQVFDTQTLAEEWAAYGLLEGEVPKPIECRTIWETPWETLGQPNPEP